MKKSKANWQQPEIIGSLGAEGGSITLFGHKGSSGNWKFARGVNDQAPTFLNEEGRRAINHTFPLVGRWPEAVALLDKYPWVLLAGLKVHPEFRNHVWQAVERRLSTVDEKYAGSPRRRWARVCDIPECD